MSKKLLLLAVSAFVGGLCLANEVHDSYEVTWPDKIAESGRTSYGFLPFSPNENASAIAVSGGPRVTGSLEMGGITHRASLHAFCANKCYCFMAQNPNGAFLIEEYKESEKQKYVGTADSVVTRQKFGVYLKDQVK
jgi:hypothetical protein